MSDLAIEQPKGLSFAALLKDDAHIPFQRNDTRSLISQLRLVAVQMNAIGESSDDSDPEKIDSRSWAALTTSLNSATRYLELHDQLHEWHVPLNQSRFDKQPNHNMIGLRCSLTGLSREASQVAGSDSGSFTPKSYLATLALSALTGFDMYIERLRTKAILH